MIDAIPADLANEEKHSLLTDLSETTFPSMSTASDPSFFFYANGSWDFVDFVTYASPFLNL